jgi:hypothetical protein
MARGSAEKALTDVSQDGTSMGQGSEWDPPGKHARQGEMVREAAMAGDLGGPAQAASSSLDSFIPSLLSLPPKTPPYLSPPVIIIAPLLPHRSISGSPPVAAIQLALAPTGRSAIIQPVRGPPYSSPCSCETVGWPCIVSVVQPQSPACCR